MVVTYLSFLCARLLDLRRETRAARRIQAAWREHKLRADLRRHQVQGVLMLECRELGMALPSNSRFPVFDVPSCLSALPPRLQGPCPPSSGLSPASREQACLVLGVRAGAEAQGAAHFICEAPRLVLLLKGAFRFPWFYFSERLSPGGRDVSSYFPCGPKRTKSCMNIKEVFS